jgi:hypothetical protein
MTTGAGRPATESVAPQPAPTPQPARWRPPVAVAVVIVGLVVGQLVALAAILAAGDSEPVMAAAFVVADLLLVAVIVASAGRGAVRLTAATLGIRRTRFWRAVGWLLAIWIGVLAIEACGRCWSAASRTSRRIPGSARASSS